jgi:hypothetical protein
MSPVLLPSRTWRGGGVLMGAPCGAIGSRRAQIRTGNRTSNRP